MVTSAALFHVQRSDNPEWNPETEIIAFLEKHYFKIFLFLRLMDVIYCFFWKFPSPKKGKMVIHTATHLLKSHFPDAAETVTTKQTQQYLNLACFVDCTIPLQPWHHATVLCQYKT